MVCKGRTLGSIELGEATKAQGDLVGGDGVVAHRPFCGGIGRRRRVRRVTARRSCSAGCGGTAGTVGVVAGRLVASIAAAMSLVVRNQVRPALCPGKRPALSCWRYQRSDLPTARAPTDTGYVASCRAPGASGSNSGIGVFESPLTSTFRVVRAAMEMPTVHWLRLKICSDSKCAWCRSTGIDSSHQVVDDRDRCDDVTGPSCGYSDMRIYQCSCRTRPANPASVKTGEGRCSRCLLPIGC